MTRPGLPATALLWAAGAEARAPLALLAILASPTAALAEMKGVACSLAPELTIALSHDNGSVFLRA